jgi:hypothetical protein
LAVNGSREQFSELPNIDIRCVEGRFVQIRTRAAIVVVLREHVDRTRLTSRTLIKQTTREDEDGEGFEANRESASHSALHI